MPPADLAGAALAVGISGWSALAALRSGGSALGVVALLAASACAFIVGRLGGQRSRSVSLAAAVMIAAGVGAWSIPDLVADRPLGRPFGYDNATAAYYVQACACALALALVFRGSLGRAAAVLGVVAFAVVPFLVDSLAGMVLAPAVIVVGLGFGARVRPRWVIRGLGAALAGVVLGTAALGAAYPRVAADPLAGALTERRLQLWSDAVQLVGQEPWFGVGHGAFDRLSPTARADADTPSAHHAFLHLAAEAGVPAGVMLLASFVWAIARCGGDPRAGDWMLRAVAGASVAALGIHASVDHVLDVAAVPMTAMFLVGLATGSPRSRSV